MSEAIVLKTPQARIDLIGCYAYIGQRNPEAARRFRLAAEVSFATLARMPGTGEPYFTTHPRLEGMRCSGITRFKNFLIFYRPIAGGIDVIRVLHAARNLKAIFEAGAEERN